MMNPKALKDSRPLRSLTSESGQGTMELALSLPMFVLLILGTAEIANLAWASVQVNNAARAGAAFGSISRANAADTTDIQSAAQNEAPKLTTLNVTSSQVCSCVTDGTPAALTCDSDALSNCPLPGAIQVAVQVRTSATISTLIRYPGLPSSYTVNAQATMGVEQ